MPTTSTTTSPTAATSLNPAGRARPTSAPRTPGGSARRGSVRRRDGIALAATGTIPDRVRAQILAERRAHLVSRQRDGIRHRLDLGLLPLTIPYGYHRAGADLPEASGVGRCGPLDRVGRSPARRWALNPETTRTVWTMATWARAGIPLTEIAARLTADQTYPRPLTGAGHPRAWTTRTVDTVLCDPALTGHGVWGRTRQGHPLPPVEWIVSRTATHPAILPIRLWHATRRAVVPGSSERGDVGLAVRPWWAQ